MAGLVFFPEGGRGMEVEDRGIWFEDREVGMECWWCVDLRF